MNEPILIIVEDYYQSRENRVYTDYAPALRADRTGLKLIIVEDE